jgi:hypothetical protein
MKVCLVYISLIRYRAMSMLNTTMSKSKCTDVLFKYILNPPEIASYLLQSTTLGKLHSGSNVLSIDRSSTGSHFIRVFLAHRSQLFVCFPQSQNDDHLTSIST